MKKNIYTNSKYEQIHYDLIKELISSLLVIAILVAILAAVFSSPDVPPLTAKQVVEQDPMVLVKTALDDLSQQDPITTYGPPYNSTPDNIQAIGPFAPQTWFGITMPINSADVEVVQPLNRITNLHPSIKVPLQQWINATLKQQTSWVGAVQKELKNSTFTNNNTQIVLPHPNNPDYGPVPALLNGYLALAKSGLLEAAIDGMGPMPLIDRTKALLLLQDRADAQYADNLDMTGDEWGIIKETGNYPGAWWLWFYSMLYQIPPFSTADAADLWVVLVVSLAVLILVFIPFIPGLNSIPRGLKVYRLIWRNYYREKKY